MIEFDLNIIYSTILTGFLNCTVLYLTPYWNIKTGFKKKKGEGVIKNYKGLIIQNHTLYNED